MRKDSDSITPLGIALSAIILAGAFFIYQRATRTIEAFNTLQRIERTGIVRIGYANEAPYAYLDSTSGEITGEAPEIARVILKRMGATEIRTVVTEFGSLIPGLKARRFDVIAAGMYITPERAEEINFSDPTYAIGEAFLVQQGNPQNLHSFEDLAENSDARIGVMGGSVEHGYARAVGIPDGRIIVLPDYPSALAALRTGRIDALAATILTANNLLQRTASEEIELARPFTDPIINGRSVKGFGAFGFRKQDVGFLQEFNRLLDDFIGTPEHLELVKPFGFSEETLPEGKTAADVLKEF